MKAFISKYYTQLFGDQEVSYENKRAATFISIALFLLIGILACIRIVENIPAD